MITKNINKIILNIREKYCLDAYKANRALITAPFGAGHFSEAVERLKGSKAVLELAEKKELAVLIITGSESRIQEAPDWARCIQVESVPGWPANARYQSRFFKWAIPFLFPNIQTSIYFDSDLFIVGGESLLMKIFDTADKNGFLTSRHQPGGWPDEYKRILKFRRCMNNEKLARQINFFRSWGVPRDIGVAQTGFVARHHNSELNSISFEVLSHIFTYSERDQLALVWALHRLKMPLVFTESDFLLTEFTPRVNPNRVCFVDSSQPSMLRYKKIAPFFGGNFAPVKKKAKKYLILSPTGADDLYQKEWVRGRRDFDVMLVNYSDSPGKHFDICDYYFEAKGFKFEVIKEAIESNIELIKKYDFIWLPDDDLKIKSLEINTLFQICRQYNLALAQPSVIRGEIIHSFLRRRFHCILRYVNFVELMCPVFSREALFKVLDTFTINRSAYGIDWLWAERLKKERVAVIDAVGVHHKRKLFSGKIYKKFNSLGISPKEDAIEILERYKLKVCYRQYGKVLKPWAKLLNIFGWISNERK